MSESLNARHTQIDFDHWCDLASSDPRAFEARRSQLIEEMIQRAPAHRQQRLRCLQWRVDKVRERSGTPLAACIRMSEMMWDALMGQGGLRDTIGCLSDEGDGAYHPPRSASILNFESRTPGNS